MCILRQTSAMKDKLAFRVAYYLVTAIFSLLLLSMVLFLVLAIFKKDPTSTVSFYQFKVKITNADNDSDYVRSIVQHTGQQEYFEEYKETEGGHSYSRGVREKMDTVLDFTGKHYFSNEPEVSFSLNTLSKNDIAFYFLQLRSIAHMVLWLLVLYQVFLVLYDVKREQFFNISNFIRMRKVGYFLLIMAALYSVDFVFRGTLTREHALLITKEFKTIIFSEKTILYTTVGCLFIVFGWVFREGTTLKEESDLTV
jgi:hypothetical protein